MSLGALGFSVAGSAGIASAQSGQGLVDGHDVEELNHSDTRVTVGHDDTCARMADRALMLNNGALADLAVHE